METLSELADRVEAATGADRELDAEIAHAIRWRWEDWAEGDLKIEDRTLAYVKEKATTGWNSIWRNLPTYTASLDAGTTLFPADTFYRSGHDGTGPDVTMFYCEAIPSMANGQPGRPVRAVALTEELARTACALRARAQVAAPLQQGDLV